MRISTFLFSVLVVSCAIVCVLSQAGYPDCPQHTDGGGGAGDVWPEGGHEIFITSPLNSFEAQTVDLSKMYSAPYTVAVYLNAPNDNTRLDVQGEGMGAFKSVISTSSSCSGVSFNDVQLGPGPVTFTVTCTNLWYNCAEQHRVDIRLYFYRRDVTRTSASVLNAAGSSTDIISSTTVAAAGTA